MSSAKSSEEAWMTEDSAVKGVELDDESDDGLLMLENRSVLMMSESGESTLPDGDAMDLWDAYMTMSTAQEPFQPRFLA